MSLLFLGILLAAVAYGYYYFIAKKAEPALALPTKVFYNDLVPPGKSGNDGQDAEMSYDPTRGEHYPELVEDAQTALLFEADKLLSEIEAIVGTKKDIYFQLQKAVPNYQLFISTDYYEVINKFIALTLKEDCGIELSKAELEALWV